MALKQWQIVIPMSGFGERFRTAGYSVPKPLIEVDGKPIIAHVVDMFPGETDITFVCNQDHLDTPSYRMEEVLRNICPTGRIIGIAPHQLGPVYAIQQVMNELKPDRPTVVNYCDFSCYWDYADFKAFVHQTGAAGIIPAYRGFHPHSLGSTYYAYLRQENGWVEAIQEKRPFTKNPISEYASSGTYYFSTAAILREYCDRTVREGIAVNGEYYVSLVYQPMLADNLPVAVYDLQHFMQWGTPADLEEYRRWSDAFARMIDQPSSPRQADTVLMPMAGAGQRFRDAGYETPKPLLHVSGAPMAVQAMRDLPSASNRRFVLRRDLPGLTEIAAMLDASFDGADHFVLDGLTDGQARTCLMALDGIDEQQPLTIGACDNGLIYDAGAFEALVESGADVVVWGVRGHPPATRRPTSYGWIDADADGHIRRIAVKQPLSDPARDPVVTGAFLFRRAGDFRAAVERLIGRDARTNGEFYVDECVNDAIALGLDCRILEVSSYLGWGTPDELKTFEYWQSCFHKWKYHPYRLERDVRVSSEALTQLCHRYAATVPARPRPYDGDKHRRVRRRAIH